MERNEHATPAVADRVGQLTPHEREILSMLALGLPNHEIAKRLALTAQALKYQVSSIYHKLGVTNRTEAAVLYLRAQRDFPEPGESNPPATGPE